MKSYSYSCIIWYAHPVISVPNKDSYDWKYYIRYTYLNIASHYIRDPMHNCVTSKYNIEYYA